MDNHESHFEYWFKDMIAVNGIRYGLKFLYYIAMPVVENFNEFLHGPSRKKCSRLQHSRHFRINVYWRKSRSTWIYIVNHAHFLHGVQDTLGSTAILSLMGGSSKLPKKKWVSSERRSIINSKGTCWCGRSSLKDVLVCLSANLLAWLHCLCFE